MLQIIIGILGIIAFSRGTIKITNKRQVSGKRGRLLGLLLLMGAAAPLFFEELGRYIMIDAFVLAIVVGLVTAEPIVEAG